MASTIKDIARRLNISVSTVSYALNGGPRSVPEEVRDKVLTVARELDYRPNRVARSLITRRSHVLGIIPHRSSRDLILGPFMQHVLNGILNEAELMMQHVLIFTRCDEKDTAGTMDQFLGGHVDGLVFISSDGLEPVLEELRHRNFPHVALSARRGASPTVTVDNVNGVERAMAHLYGLGHRKIGHLRGIPTHYDGWERHEAYSDFMRRHGLPINPSWIVDGRFTPFDGRCAALKILDRPDRPTAVFAANDEMALGLLEAARELGISVPSQLSVVGFDDSPHAALCYPRLTTVRQPLNDIGAAAARMLLDIIEERDPVTSLRFGTELVIRDTTARPTEDQS